MRWLIITLICSVLVLGGVAMAVRAFPLPPTTPAAAVAAALDEHDVAYVRVEVREGGCVPAPESCQVYKAEVAVMGDREYVGRVECARVWEQCRLWVAQLDLRGEPLPSLAHEPPWLAVARRAFERIAATLRR